MIQEGLLWFDDSPTRAISDKIGRSVARYQQKYGHNPDVCYVHPAHLHGGEMSLADGVKVLASKSVLPNHFWLGVEGATGAGEQACKKRAAAESGQCLYAIHSIIS